MPRRCLREAMRRCRVDARHCSPLSRAAVKRADSEASVPVRSTQRAPYSGGSSCSNSPTSSTLCQQPGTAVALAEESTVEDRGDDATDPAGNPQHQDRVVLRAVALSCEAVMKREHLNARKPGG